MDPQSRILNPPASGQVPHENQKSSAISSSAASWFHFANVLTWTGTGQDNSPHPTPPPPALSRNAFSGPLGSWRLPSKPMMDFGFLSCFVHPSIIHFFFV